MSADVIASIVTGVLVVIGALGIIIPVLPGSITIIIGLLVWAIVVGGPVGWVVFAIGGVLAAAGMSSSWILTGTRLKRHEIPNRSILIGGIAGVVGIFVLPFLGLPIGFAAGLYLSELARVSDARKAWESSWEALKATGIGLLIELGCAGLAIFTWLIGLLIHFTG